MSHFDENSSDAMFSRILERLDGQDRAAEARDKAANEKLDRIERQALKTNGRVTLLESWQTDVKARVAVVAGSVSVVIAVAAAIVEHVWR